MKKGFTLIELLAVIVILAIIALIATPIVLDIINSTKESSGKRSKEYYLEAVEQAITREQLNGKTIKSGTYTIMNDGNLCYVTQTTDTCLDENKIAIQIEGEPLTAGTIVIQDGEIANTDLRDIKNIEGLIIMNGRISKSYNEETGKNEILLTIRAEEVLGEVSFNNLIGLLEYDSNKYTYGYYYRGSLPSYYIGNYSDNAKTIMSAESSDFTINPSFIVGYMFYTDDLEAADASDFTFYVKIGTSESKNVPIQQKSSSGVTILNYMKDDLEYFKAVKSDIYDYAPGDINDDGYIDGTDFSELSKYVYGEADQPCKAMDITGDGSIDLNDYVRFKKYFSCDGELQYSPMTEIPGHL